MVYKFIQITASTGGLKHGKTSTLLEWPVQTLESLEFVSSHEVYAAYHGILKCMAIVMKKFR